MARGAEWGSENLREVVCQRRTLCPGVVEVMGMDHAGAALGTHQVLTSVGSWDFLWFALDFFGPQFKTDG